MTASTARFGFTKLLVADLEKAAAFYTTVFGFTEQYRVHSDIGDRVIDEILFEPAEPGAHMFVLLKFEGVTAPSNDELIIGFVTTGIEDVVQRAIEAGATIEREVRTQPEHGVKVAFVKDPEGHLLELVETLPR